MSDRRYSESRAQQETPPYRKVVGPQVDPDLGPGEYRVPVPTDERTRHELLSIGRAAISVSATTTRAPEAPILTHSECEIAKDHAQQLVG